MASRGSGRGRKPFVQGSRETVVETHAWLDDMATDWEGMFFKFVFSKAYHAQGIIVCFSKTMFT